MIMQAFFVTLLCAAAMTIFFGWIEFLMKLAMSDLRGLRRYLCMFLGMAGFVAAVTILVMLGNAVAGMKK